MKRTLCLLLVGLVAGCGGRIAADPIADAGPPDPVYECRDVEDPATTLACTGLFANVATKKLAPGVKMFAPAVHLWSDGADKTRWISLPPGTKIDASDPNEWRFPVGTKVWKEFRVDGKRVETRLFQKARTNYWVHATYTWNGEETEANRFAGGDIEGPAGTYHVPIQSECEDCHRGRTERVLGFEQVSLGLPGAEGVTLADLVRDDLIEPPPARTTYEIGDDGTGAAAEPLAWLHINCGTTCHNDNSDATAFGTSMRLRLNPSKLDGRSIDGIDSVATTVGVSVHTAHWNDRTRIVPGNPDASLLVELISNRSAVDPENSQMPPIASRVVDEVDTAKVVEWIRKMPSGAP